MDQRDGIERLRHGAIQGNTLRSVGYLTLVGWWLEKRGLDAREISETDLLAGWGGNPVNTQINVIHRFQQARENVGPNWWWSILTRPIPQSEDLHLGCDPGQMERFVP